MEGKKVYARRYCKAYVTHMQKRIHSFNQCVFYVLCQMCVDEAKGVVNF